MNLFLLVGAIVITVLVFLWVVRVFKATLKTAFLIAAIVFGLQFFGIGSDKIFAEVTQIIQAFWNSVPGK
jgi:sulfite exporter TauE/SafE